MADAPHPDVLGTFAQTQLRSIIKRVERLEVEKAEIVDQIKEVFAEAKGNGFDVKILRLVIRRRKQDRARQQEEDAILDLYLSALGELPLFEATTAAEAGPVIVADPDAKRVLHKIADDPRYREACDLVLKTGIASTSYIQRRLQLGYNRAASLIERMEQDGVIGPANHAGKREVLAHA